MKGFFECLQNNERIQKTTSNAMHEDSPAQNTTCKKFMTKSLQKNN